MAALLRISAVQAYQLHKNKQSGFVRDFFLPTWKNPTESSFEARCRVSILRSTTPSSKTLITAVTLAIVPRSGSSPGQSHPQKMVFEASIRYATKDRIAVDDSRFRVTRRARCRWYVLDAA